jgi:hypothetical protein
MVSIVGAFYINYLLFSWKHEVEGGDSCGTARQSETPQTCLQVEEARREPAESVRLERLLQYLFLYHYTYN